MQVRNLLRIHLRNIQLLRVSRLRSYRANLWIEPHHTLSNLSCWIKVTVSGFIFGPLPHTTLIRQILKCFDNIWNILQTDISNVIPWLFVLIWPSDVLDNQRLNKPLSWSSQIIFWLWRCYFYIFQTNKIQKDIQGDVLLTILDLPLFPRIVPTAIFHVHRCELSIPESLTSGAIIINRRWCCNF